MRLLPSLGLAVAVCGGALPQSPLPTSAAAARPGVGCGAAVAAVSHLLARLLAVGLAVVVGLLIGLGRLVELRRQVDLRGVVHPHPLLVRVVGPVVDGVVLVARGHARRVEHLRIWAR